MGKLPLYLKVTIALVLGVVWAIIAPYLGIEKFTIDYIAPFGEIFIRLLKLIAIPLVLLSIISGVSNIGNPKNLGKLGIKTLAYYIGTTVIAVTLGLLIVNVVKPGNYISDNARESNYEQYHDQVSSLKAEANKEVGPLDGLVETVPENLFGALGSSSNMLQIIFFAVFFGIALLYIDKGKAKIVSGFLDGVNMVFVKMIDIIMKAAPFFVFALMAGILTDIASKEGGSLFDVFASLGMYTVCVAGGLLLMAFGVYPLIMKLVKKDFSYVKFFKGISAAQALAFSTSSSAATLPVTIECVEDNLGISKKTTSFVLPIGATINMDGTSLYQAVAVVFLAQMYNIDLTWVQQLTIVLTSTLASIGSAAIPSAGLLMLMVVLQSVGLNAEWIIFVMPVDRILDMLRTTVNITGDATVCTLVDDK